MQHMQFRAKSAKNGLKPTDFLNRNFYFETEGVCVMSNVGLTKFYYIFHIQVVI
jgi:hypothetical protein